MTYLRYSIYTIFVIPFFFLEQSLLFPVSLFQLTKIVYLEFFYLKNRSIYRLLHLEFITYTFGISVYTSLFKLFGLDNETWVMYEQIGVLLIYYGTFMYQLFVVYYAYCFVTKKEKSYSFLYYVPLFLYFFEIFYYVKYEEKIINEIILTISVVYLVFYIGFLADIRKTFYEHLNLRSEVLLFLGAVLFINYGAESILFMNTLKTNMPVSYGFISLLGVVTIISSDKVLDKLFYSTSTFVVIVSLLVLSLLLEEENLFVTIHFVLILVFCFVGYLLRKYRYSMINFGQNKNSSN